MTTTETHISTKLNATDRAKNIVAQLDADVERAHANEHGDADCIVECAVKTATNARWAVLHWLLLDGASHTDIDRMVIAKRCDDLRAEIMKGLGMGD